jgi:hypothetical protein
MKVRDNVSDAYQDNANVHNATNEPLNLSLQCLVGSGNIYLPCHTSIIPQCNGGFLESRELVSDTFLVQVMKARQDHNNVNGDRSGCLSSWASSTKTYMTYLWILETINGWVSSICRSSLLTYSLRVWYAPALQSWHQIRMARHWYAYGSCPRLASFKCPMWRINHLSTAQQIALL